MDQPGSFNHPSHQWIGNSQVFIKHPSVNLLVKLLRTSMRWQNGASAPQSNVLGALSRWYLMNPWRWQRQLPYLCVGLWPLFSSRSCSQRQLSLEKQLLYLHRDYSSSLDCPSPVGICLAFHRGRDCRFRHGWVCGCTMDILILWKLVSQIQLKKSQNSRFFL